MLYEISERRPDSDGRRFVKLILAEIAPPDSVVDKTGTIYNRNGLTFIEEYVEPHLDSIANMSITADFLDEERTELYGHGERDGEVDDGMPTFPDAEVVGHCTRGYIDDVEIDGTSHRVIMADGLIDEMRYTALVDKLQEKLARNEQTSCSVEIYRPPHEDAIVYLDGWKPKGRIPVDFVFSGVALLGVEPACPIAQLVELNKYNMEDELMNEEFVKALDTLRDSFVENVKAEINAVLSDNADIEKVRSELNTVIADRDALIAAKQALDEQINDLYKQMDDLRNQLDEAWQAKRTADDALAEMKLKEVLARGEAAMSEFTEEELAPAAERIEAFRANPVESEINAICEIVYAEIGRKARLAHEEAVKTAEKNAVSETEDTYGNIEAPKSIEVPDDSIY